MLRRLYDSRPPFFLVKWFNMIRILSCFSLFSIICMAYNESG